MHAASNHIIGCPTPLQRFKVQVSPEEAMPDLPSHSQKVCWVMKSTWDRCIRLSLSAYASSFRMLPLVDNSCHREHLVRDKPNRLGWSHLDNLFSQMCPVELHVATVYRGIPHVHVRVSLKPYATTVERFRESDVQLSIGQLTLLDLEM